MNEPTNARCLGSLAETPWGMHLLVATTWHCNLACSYCFVESSRRERHDGRMSPAIAARVVEALDELVDPRASVFIHLYGGEPLTNLPAMAAMVESAARRRPKRFAFGITTNGTTATDEAIELLARGEFEISLSIDGPPEIHDTCRRTPQGAATHARVIAFLGAIRERTRCRVRGSAVIRPGWTLAQASVYLHSLGVDTFKAQIARVPPGSPFQLSIQERQQYLRDLEAVASDVTKALDEGRTPADGRFTSRILQLLRGARRAAFCSVGDRQFGILPSGHVVPCVLIHPVEAIWGHIEDDPRTWLAEGRRWRESRQLRHECSACDQLDLCAGGCPAIMPVCGAGECEFVRKECELAAQVFETFRSRPERLLALVGIH